MRYTLFVKSQIYKADRRFRIPVLTFRRLTPYIDTVGSAPDGPPSIPYRGNHHDETFQFQQFVVFPGIR